MTSPDRPQNQKEPNPQPNRLIDAKSPYLLQHAYNPVDWRQWDDTAFEAAREQDKPILLSIGYSTCHWCHVMERESFEDEGAAALLNEVFICIKVDREERPDVDMAYMTVCQLMTGSGGWPLTLVLTPDKRPLFAGTYLPKESLPGRMGLLDLTAKVASLWKSKRDELLHSATNIMGHIRQYEEGSRETDEDAAAPDADTIDAGARELADRYDPDYGGFGNAPKFPAPHNLLLLLRHHKRTGSARSLEMAERTLAAMRSGGMFDHVGFGFHRYSTDREWLLPHFEKMLYDQAMLSMAYVEAFQATGRMLYARTVEKVFTYVLRDLTHADGGFLSAEDADSEGEEGKFYVFTLDEVRSILSTDDLALAERVFGLRDEGNFRDEATGQRTGANILHLADPRAAADAPPEKLEAIRQQLYEYRDKRVRPHLDDKVLADWNGLMIAAMAKGGAALSKPDYVAAAARAADFVLERMYADGALLHRWRDGEAGLPAHLDDYAFFAWGLIELHQATGEPRWLLKALDITDRMLDEFWDEDEGQLRFSAQSVADDLPITPREVFDAAIPAGNSIAVMNLLRLSKIVPRAELERTAMTILQHTPTARKHPSGHTMLLCAADFAVGPTREVVLAGRDDAVKPMLAATSTRFLPRTTVLRRDPALFDIAPYTESMQPPDQGAAAYVCKGYACQEPVHDVAALEGLLDG